MTRLCLGPGILRELEQDSACVYAQKPPMGACERKPEHGFQNRLAPSFLQPNEAASMPSKPSQSRHCPETARGQRSYLCVCSQTPASHLPARRLLAQGAIKGGICGKPQVNKVQARWLGAGACPSPAQWAGLREAQSARWGIHKRLNEIQREAHTAGPTWTEARDGN